MRPSAVDRVRAAYARLHEVDRPEVWCTLRAEADVLADAAAIDRRVAAGEALPLAGTTLGVKDNVDVAGLPTTAACPAFAYVPERDATAVARLRAAGAIVVGKTNLDQFATGLIGTRSPYGAVRDAWRPEYVSGGSSSGSAVAVALGVCDLAVGTDTAGSGRVPAAFAGIVGIKPTRGLVPTRGTVPACRTLDCVTIFAPHLAAAEQAIDLMIGPDPDDPRSRAWPADARGCDLPGRGERPQGSHPRVGVPAGEDLDFLTDEGRAAFAAAARRLAASGATLSEVSLAPLVAAGDLLYGGAFVAERFAAVGPWVRDHLDECDPVVGPLILAAEDVPAHALVADGERLDHLRLATTRLLAGLDALLVPTTARQPTLAEVAADPIGTNDALGRLTRCGNLLDLCGVAVPAGTADGGHFGVTLLGDAFHDRALMRIGERLVG